MAIVAASHFDLRFFAGGGKLGALIRAHDWSTTPLGQPESWPQSLRSALSICLQSSFPTAIYWGPELHLLYNDAWAPIPAERHPGALGRPAAEVWADIWAVVGPQFERVLATGEGFSAFDQMLPMVRGGEVKETYWNYSFTPIRGEDGAVAGVFNQGHETTGRVLAERQKAAETERLRRMFDQAPGFMAMLRGPGHVFELANAAYTQLVGHRDVVGKPVREALPEVQGQGFFELLDNVFATGQPFVGRAMPVNLQRRPGGAVERRFVDLVYQPVTDATGAITGIFVEGSDVTERVGAEAELRESEARHRALVKASSDVVYRMNPDWTEMRRLDGRGLIADTQEPSARWLEAYILPEDRSHLMAAVSEAVRSQGVFEQEHQVRRVDGSVGWIFSRAIPVLDANGEVTEWFGMAADVTARRQAEAEQRASEARFRALVEASATTVWTTDAQGRVAEDSPSWRSFTGQSLEEWLGWGWVDAVHPDDRAYAGRQWAEAVAAKRPFDTEFRLRHAASGGWRLTRARAVPLRDEAGLVASWVGMNIDVEDAHRAQAALQESEARLRASFAAAERKAAELRAVLESMPDAVYIGGVEGITLANQPALDQLGFATREELNRHVATLAEEIQTRDAETGAPISVEDQVFTRALGGERVVQDVRVRHRVSGEERIVRCAAAPVVVDGQVTAAVAVNTDVTEARRAVEDLRESEARQRFRVELGDALRPLVRPAEIQAKATRLLGDHLHASRVHYAEIEPDGEHAVVPEDHALIAPNRAGRYRLADFATLTAECLAGRNFVASDLAADPRLSEAEKAIFSFLPVAAMVVVPLVKEGRLIAVLAVHRGAPYAWSAGEIALVEETAERTWAALERARTEAALRESEERFKFLDRLGEATARTFAPREIMATTARLLGGHLRVTRCAYADVDPDNDRFTIRDDWTNGAPSSAGEYSLDLFGSRAAADMRAGRTLVVRDVDGELPADDGGGMFSAIGIKALVCCPLVKQGRLVAMMAVHQSLPRDWARGEITLLETVAERAWAHIERVRTEAALRESEERLRLIVEGARDYAIFTMDVQGRIDTWLPGAANVFGWSREEAVGQPVAVTFTPEDREGGEHEEELETARREGRAPDVRWHLRKDGSRVFIEGSVTALRRPDGGIRSFLKIGQDVTGRRAAEEAQALLAREVDHRAKNALTVVQTMLRLTRADDVPSFVRAVEGRVAALARAQTLLAEGRWNGAALHAMLQGELAPFLAGQRADLDGPPMELPPGTAQPLAMAVHELATNAAKHGALSVPQGHVSVSWHLGRSAPSVLSLRWAEMDGPPVAGPPTRRGFGSRVLEGTVRAQLGGTVWLTWGTAGLVCEMEVPLGRRPALAEANETDASLAD
ncbi:MAG TPA: PAS domain S-box protein [Falsiroseomonas sp.]|nr:PAS domain S-box protein [Falsiroseomonas sp.]